MSINATSTLGGPPPSHPTYHANPSKGPTLSEPTMTLAEKREIHNAKVGASTWAIFYGPLKPIWDFLFYNPSKAAKKRLDVRSGERSELSGEALEKEKRTLN